MDNFLELSLRLGLRLDKTERAKILIYVPLVGVSGYLIVFYEVSRFLANDATLRIGCINFQPLQIAYKSHLTTSGRLAVTTKPCKIQKRVIPHGKIIHRAIFSQKLKFLP